MQCKKCGEVQDDKYKFCKKCGAPLTKDGNKCISCGEILESDAEFCPFCGTAQKQTVAAESKPEQPAADENAFYGGNASVNISDRKPLVIGKKGRYIGAMVKAWVMTVLFVIMFGMSFASFMKVDVSDYVRVNEPVKISAVDVLEAAFAKKLSKEEVLRQFAKAVAGAKDEAAVIRALNKFNALKFVYNKDVMEAMPFTANLSLVLQTVLVLALMLGSLTFAVLFFTEALMLTVKGKSFLKKDIAGVSLGIMTALALFILCTTVGAIGAGPLAAMIIGLSALALNTAYNAVIENKRPDSAKQLVSRIVSLALGITLLFTLNCNAIFARVDIGRETQSGKKYTETLSEGTSVDGLMFGVDLFIADKDNPIYMKDYSFDDLVGGSDAEWESGERLPEILPPLLYFYAEMNSGFNAVGLMLGILSFITYLLSGISLAVLLAFIMVSLTDHKRKPTFAAHLLSLIGLVGMLVTAIIGTATASSILTQLDVSNYLHIVIGAAPVINTVLATGLFVQNCILAGKKKKQ